MLMIFLTIFTVISLGLIGFFTYLANRKSNINKSFSVFVGSILAWVIANFIGANYKEHAFSQYFVHADFFLGPIMIYLFWVFTKELYVRSVSGINKQYKKLPMASIAFVASFASLLSIIVSVTYEGYLKIEYGVLYIIYAVIIGLFVLAGLNNIRVAFKQSKGVFRAQLNVVITGLTVAIAMLMISNLLVPQFTNSSDINLIAGNLSYIGIVFFALMTAYGIVKHKLFNIQLVVARSATYLLLIAALASLYAVLVFGVVEVFLRPSNTLWMSDFIPIAVALIIAATAPYLKRYFDQATSSIFFRDAYDPQVFLDQLTKTIISNIELGILLRHSARVIEENLRCEYVTFCVFEGDMENVRFIGSGQKNLKNTELIAMKKFSSKIGKVVDADEQEIDNPELYALLNRNSVGVLAYLKSSVKSESETAYMLLGPKKSGNRYSQQDLKIIEIIADELVIAIQNALRFEEIQNFSITLQQKVDEATKKLVKTNQKLKELDATKDDFISMASHQLRTPLTSVKGLLSMVVEGDAGKLTPLQQEMLTQAYVSSQRMTYLIADLLNASRLKSGKFAIERSVTNLAVLAQQEVAQLVETAKARSLTLTCEIPDDFPELMLDETKTRQLIMNFIDNAIYYTPSGGAITVKVVDKPKSVELLVVDTGLGVPKADQPRLFTKFYRAKNAQNARPDGTGLGLFMAKKVVIAQGGAIIFKSQEGKGSTFGFSFPKTPELTDLSQQPVTTIIKNP